MAMTEDDVGPEATAEKSVEEQIGDGAPRRMVGPDRERIEAEALARKATPKRVVFTITVERGAPNPTMQIDGPATGFDALAALSMFFEAMNDCKPLSADCSGPWPPGLEAAREELRAMARVARIDMGMYRRDIAR